MKFPFENRIHWPVIIVFLMVLAAGSALASEFERTFTFDSQELRVASLVGAIEVIPASGDEFKVTVRVQGDDASEDLLEFQAIEDSKGQLLVQFPIEKHRKYVYPAMGRNAKTTIQFGNEEEEGSWLKKVLSGISGKRITVRGKGNGIEMWADITIEVPRGAVLEVKQGVGKIGAAQVVADLNLDINSGSITSHDIEGEFIADTGSGRVEATSIRGDVHIDTGSGRVSIEDIDGNKVLVDTGSGRVTAEGVRCESLVIDTGSGSVKAAAVETDQAIIDTGSGSVSLQLDRLGDGRFRIDTGSGGINLMLPEDASANIYADTGSGSVNNKLSGATVRSKSRNEMELTVGDGDARIILDAGSGSITVQ